MSNRSLLVDRVCRDLWLRVNGDDVRLWAPDFEGDDFAGELDSTIERFRKLPRGLHGDADDWTAAAEVTCT